MSLPSKWVKNHNVRKGDELNIVEEDAALRIFSGEERLFTKKTKIDFSNKDWGVMHSILAVLHKSGYDEIEITFDNPKTADVIQERINNMLMGYEIIDQKKNVCVVKSVSGDHLSELDALIRRIFLVTLSLAQSSLEGAKTGDKARLREVLVLEQTINKLTNYSQRLLNKKPYKDEQTIYTYLIVWVLESICDDYRDMVNAILEKPIKISQSLIEAHEQVNALVNDYYHFFYNYSNEELGGMREQVKTLKKRLIEVKCNSREEILRVLLFSITSRILDCFGSTTGMHH